MPAFVKLPLWQSVSWSAQWALAVALRHQVTFAAYVACGVMVGLLQLAVPEIGDVAWIIYCFALAPLAVLSHNEVLRGPSALDAATLGAGGRRAWGYALDTFILGLFAIVFAVPMVVAVVVATVADGEGGQVLLVLGTLLAVVLAAVGLSRLCLKLPARALGVALGWRDAWRLGAGNTLTLALAPLLLSLPFALLHGVSQALISGAFTQLLDMALLPAQLLLTCAFLSVAYGQLTAAGEGA